MLQCLTLTVRFDGYSVIPKKLQLEMESCKEHFDETHNCLICDMLEDEMNCGDRIIMENEDFVTFLPFFSEYPYGMYIAVKRHVQNLSQLTDSEKTNLAKILKETTGTFDSLFDYKFPYMMCMYQNPVNGEDVSDYYHFHIAFYPPMRSADKIKYNASSETGAWAHCNTTAPEAMAVELRAAHEKFLKNERLNLNESVDILSTDSFCLKVSHTQKVGFIADCVFKIAFNHIYCIIDLIFFNDCPNTFILTSYGGYAVCIACSICKGIYVLCQYPKNVPWIVPNCLFRGKVFLYHIVLMWRKRY